MTRPKILLVDTSDDSLSAMRDSLENEDFEVVSARTCHDAIAAIVTQSFDVLITDLSLRREHGGFTVVTTMNDLQPQALKIVLSHSGDIQEAMAVLLKVDEVIVRPFEVNRVTELIRSKTPGRKSNVVAQQRPRSEGIA